MRLLLAATAVVAIVAATVVAAQPSSTALSTWTGAYQGVPPFDKATPAQFPAAFDAALAAQRAEIARIAGDPAAPTFANTIVPFERSGEMRDRIEAIFGVMTSNTSTPAYEALDKEWAPKLAAADDAITFDERLFRRIAAVNAKPAGLSPAQARLTQRYYDRFVRAGAQLDGAKKAELGKLNQQLAGLFADFSAKLLADENSWTLVTRETDLAGVPAAQVAAYKAAADERKLTGWAIVNTRSSVDPLLTFAANRRLREQVWTKFVNRGDNGDANDTNATIARIVKLRADRAKLLGFRNHAEWRMQDTMAKDPAKAKALMARVLPSAIARVREEVADMQKIASADKVTIAPWDYRFYAEKVRKSRYDLDQAELKPYFELDNMIAASMWAAEKLYGFTFKEVTGTVPVWAPGIRVWEVRDPARNKGSDNLVGLFYDDNFARAGKRSGAWMTTYRSQSTFDGPRIVLASNNNNFTPAPAGAPVLISLDDARTLFHEFGHALHYLSLDVTYPGFGNTPRDFVEYPSQFNEHWVLTREVLDRFARHYQTKAPMPAALVAKIKASEKFNQGFEVLEAQAAANVDMALHTDPDGIVDPDAFEKAELARIGMPKEIVMRHRLPQFGHLFSSDSYSAGYYSYLWSEVMDADTWAAFEESKTPWDPAIAARYKATIMASGNQTDRTQAFRAFRGRDVDVAAYLKEKGFPVR